MKTPTATTPPTAAADPASIAPNLLTQLKNVVAGPELGEAERALLDVVLSEVCVDIMTVETQLRPTPRDGCTYQVATMARGVAAWAVTVFLADGGVLLPEWRKAGYRRGRTHVVAWATSYQQARSLRAAVLNARKVNLAFLPTIVAPTRAVSSSALEAQT